ncbi:ornithine decarboxylase 1-like [Cimex lectularius]|uniref:ornithine decarboxylase n=1 Tax=Cimex lectularius TaxID=79782 RepID=A0A8I6S972_CIMLE|nr:ornithine decarboxylase 1-like [Cimex lectularius]
MKIPANNAVSVIQDGRNAWKIIEDITSSPNQEDAFFVMNLKDIVKQYEAWVNTLPNIKPYYAVKCNDSEIVLKVLSALGTNFDCASKGEIGKVLSLGVKPERIIYANPVKQISHLRYAKSVGVNLMTFDSCSELYKIREYHPYAKLVLRICADAADSQCPAMGLKFGIAPHMAHTLIKLASSLNLDIIGVSFHVGSGCRENQAYKRALDYAKDVYEQCRNYGFDIELIDIGGGFTKESFENMSSSVLEGICEHFPFFKGSFIAEPGRFFVTNAYTLATRIHSKRIDKSSHMYYINDGLYGSFNCLLFDKAEVLPIPLKKHSGPMHKSTIWGPTCDSLDLITQNFPLPEMSLGDWIIFDNMGAYTITTSTNFNGFEQPKVHHFADKETWDLLKDIIPDIFTFETAPSWFKANEKIIM